MFDITSIINTQAIPVFLLPLNGLLCTVFYTRYSNISTRVHKVQNVIRQLLNEPASKRKKLQENIRWTKVELKQLHLRSNLILFTLLCLLISVLSFCFCAVFITLTIKNPEFFKMALTLWFVGPILIVIGLSSAIYELSVSRKTVKIQSKLIKLWSEEEETSSI